MSSYNDYKRKALENPDVKAEYQNVLWDNPVRSKASVVGRKQYGFKVYSSGFGRRFLFLP